MVLGLGHNVQHRPVTVGDVGNTFTAEFLKYFHLSTTQVYSWAWVSIAVLNVPAKRGDQVVFFIRMASV